MLRGNVTVFVARVNDIGRSDERFEGAKVGHDLTVNVFFPCHGRSSDQTRLTIQVKRLPIGQNRQVHG